MKHTVQYCLIYDFQIQMHLIKKILKWSHKSFPKKLKMLYKNMIIKQYNSQFITHAASQVCV